MSFLLLNLLIIFVIFFLLFLLSMVWPPDSPWAPWWRTNKNVARQMCRLGKVSEKDTIYDLGSGDGGALIVAAKEFGAKGVGIEIDPLRFFIATLMIRINRVEKKMVIKRKNFFNEDISAATLVFLYLVPKALEKLKSKLLKELKPGTFLVSYKYKIDYFPLVDYDSRYKIYLYKVP